MTKQKIIVLSISSLFLLLFWLISPLLIEAYGKVRQENRQVEPVTLTEAPPIVKRYINFPQNAKITTDSKVIDGQLVAPIQISISWTTEFQDGSTSNNFIYLFPRSLPNKARISFSYYMPDRFYLDPNIHGEKLSLPNNRRIFLEHVLIDKRPLDILGKTPSYMNYGTINYGSPQSDGVTQISTNSGEMGEISWGFDTTNISNTDLGLPQNYERVRKPSPRTIFLFPVYIFVCTSPLASCGR